MKFFFCGGSNLVVEPRLNIILEEELFPALVANFFNAEYINVSKSGSSNRRTIRKIFYEYDMKDYDLIFIDFTPDFRTEFYDDKKKKWHQISPFSLVNFGGDAERERLRKVYYEEIYNEEYGNYNEKIDYNIITKYLNELGVNYSTMLSGVKTTDFKNKSNLDRSKLLQTDYYTFDYPTESFHLTTKGHQAIAQDIIKKYENILQR